MNPPRNTDDRYDIRAYGDMIADRVRMTAYQAALARAIRPGMVVMDIGAGTGILSLLACKLGARKVYAVEPSDSITVGMELARANGFTRQIEFIQATSFDFTPPTQADVIVSDLRGVLPLHTTHIPSILDARQRLLAPNGILVPQSDSVQLQLVSDPEVHSRLVGIWREGLFGLDLSPALHWAGHLWRRSNLSASVLIAQPATAFELDYRTLQEANVRCRTEWTISDESVMAHGLAAWFDVTLMDGIGFSTAPHCPRTSYGQAFFTFPEAIHLIRGDKVTVTLAATLVGGQYVWQWDTKILGGGGREKADFRQSSFQASPINPSRIAQNPTLPSGKSPAD